MNLEPYLGFMLKLQGNYLILQDNKIPKLQLSNKKKEIGTKIIKAKFITQFLDNLLNNSQKQELREKKTIRCDYISPSGAFKIQVEKNANDYLLIISPKNKKVILANSPKKNHTQQLEIGIALLRMTIGTIIIVAWYKNITSGLYTSENFTELFNWLFDKENGNGSSLTFYKTILDIFVVPMTGIFSIFMLIFEFAIGLGLLLGVFTRFFSLLSMLLFFNFFLSHFGGQEWIWSYILLFMSSLVVFLGYAGRKWGIDTQLLKWHGEPIYPFMW